MKYVTVKFLSERDAAKYHGPNGSFFYGDKTGKLKKHDAVIVPTQYGLALALVTGVNRDPEDLPHFVNESNVKQVAEKIKSKAVEEITRIERAGEIKKALDREIKKVDEVQKYKMYADLSPEVASLIKELEDLKV